MLIRRFAPRQCQRLTCFSHTRPWRRRFATEITSADTAFDNHVEQAESLSLQLSDSFPNDQNHAATSTISPESDYAVETYMRREHILSTTENFGADVEPHYRPVDLLTNPPSPSDVTLELLMASQTHLGHATSLWHPANSKYIFGIREGIHIISLDITAAHLRRAAKVVSSVAERGGVILFVGTKRGFEGCVVKAAEMSGAYHLFERWIPGTITNGEQILGGCRMVAVDELDQVRPEFQDQLYERSVVKPDLVVCLHARDHYVMLHECGLAGIPTIGVVDTDANPSWVTYPIPANDDSLRSVQVIAGVLGRAGEEGQKRRRAAAARGKITYAPAPGLQAAAPLGQEGKLSLSDMIDSDEVVASNKAITQEYLDELKQRTLQAAQETQDEAQDTSEPDQMGVNLPDTETPTDPNANSTREMENDDEMLENGHPERN